MIRHSLHVPLSAVLAAACVFAFSACGGHSRGDGDGSSNVPAPAFDVSGDWTSTLDHHHLGVTSFSMKSDGALSGTLQTDSGEKGTISGQLAANDADFTVEFGSRTFLAEVVFSSTQASASGTLVDSDGNVHVFQLTR